MASSRTRKRKQQRLRRAAYLADLRWWSGLTQEQRLVEDYTRATRKPLTMRGMDTLLKETYTPYITDLFESSALYDLVRPK